MPRKRFYYFQAHRKTAALCSPIIPGEVEKWELAIARSRDMGSKRNTRLPRQQRNRRWPGKSVSEARSDFRMVTEKAIKIRSVKKDNYYTRRIALNKSYSKKNYWHINVCVCVCVCACVRACVCLCFTYKTYIYLVLISFFAKTFFSTKSSYVFNTLFIRHNTIQLKKTKFSKK